MKQHVEEAITTARAWRATGVGVEDILAGLRVRGLSLAESQLVLMRATGLSFFEAHDVLLSSSTWLDRREEMRALNEAFCDVLDSETVDEEPDGA